MEPRTLSRLRLTTRVLIVAGLAFTLLLAIYSPIRAQGFSVESKSAPSVVGAGTFISLEGRFSLALPQEVHGFRPLSIASCERPTRYRVVVLTSWDAATVSCERPTRYRVVVLTSSEVRTICRSDAPSLAVTLVTVDEVSTTTR